MRNKKVSMNTTPISLSQNNNETVEVEKTADFLNNYFVGLGTPKNNNLDDTSNINNPSNIGSSKVAVSPLETHMYSQTMVNVAGFWSSGLLQRWRWRPSKQDTCYPTSITRV